MRVFDKVYCEVSETVIMVKQLLKVAWRRVFDESRIRKAPAFPVKAVKNSWAWCVASTPGPFLLSRSSRGLITAHLMPKDDPVKRLETLDPNTSREVRMMGTDLLTVRIDLDQRQRA